MIELPQKKRKPKTVNPRTLVLFGRTKVGKTYMAQKLQNALIIDTERGANYIEGLITEANSIKDLSDIYLALKENCPYSYIVIDTLDLVYQWFEERVVKEQELEHVGDLDYGKGYSIARDDFMNLKRKFEEFEIPLILYGHRKRSIIGSDKVEVETKSLDLPGKLKNILCADVDGIGYVFRDENNKLKVSFKTNDANDIDAGCRVEHLKGKVIDFKWENIFK